MKKNVFILLWVVTICFIIFSANSVKAIGEANSLQSIAMNKKVELNYSDESFWDWHTRNTTNDLAYNGKHITMGDAVHFYGYGINSHKDFLYKKYDGMGEKTFKFKLDETKGNYHTLDGAGFIFNAKEENGKLTGDILLFTQTQIVLYRIENVDINSFENTPNKLVSDYATKTIASVNKPVGSVHKLIVKTSPTNVTVIDNDVEVLNIDLDSTTHAGEDFGLLVSYVQHNCSILTEIEFSNFELEIIDYKTFVKTVDQFEDSVKGATFDVINEEGKIIRTFTTDSNGEGYTEGLQAGEYILKQCSAPEGYKMCNDERKFLIGDSGIVSNKETKERTVKEIETEIKVLNEKLIPEPEPVINTEPQEQIEVPVTLPYAGTNTKILLTAIILSIFSAEFFIINRIKRK